MYSMPRCILAMVVNIAIVMSVSQTEIFRGCGRRHEQILSLTIDGLCCTFGWIASSIWAVWSILHTAAYHITMMLTFNRRPLRVA